MAICEGCVSSGGSVSALSNLWTPLEKDKKVLPCLSEQLQSQSWRPVREPSKSWPMVVLFAFCSQAAFYNSLLTLTQKLQLCNGSFQSLVKAFQNNLPNLLVTLLTYTPSSFCIAHGSVPSSCSAQPGLQKVTSSTVGMVDWEMMTSPKIRK